MNKNKKILTKEIKYHIIKPYNKIYEAFMRRILKSLALTLALAMIFSLTACNVGLNRKTPTDVKNFEFVLSGDEYLIKVKEGVTLTGTVILPDEYEGKKVTGICIDGFKGQTEITKISMSSCLKIGGYAFDGCTKLATIEWSNDLTVIGQGAFTGCRELINIGKFPATLERIESRAFDFNSELRVVRIPASVTYIADDAFINAENVTFEVDYDNPNYKVDESGKIVTK